MINHYDIAYGLGVGLSSPFWLVKSSARKKVLRAFSQRMGKVPRRDLSRPAIMIHAVSLGEINASRSLIELIRRQRPDMHFIVSVTTETGYARGKELYGAAHDVTLARYPLDFTPAVERLLTTLKPSLVVLLELEVWPNFIRRCRDRGVPVLLINGRITESSFRRYRMARPLVGSMFGRLEHVCAQDQTYADRFVQLGASARRVSVTGTMKFDTATIADRIDGQEELAANVGLHPASQRIWICGSTGPGEEQMILPIYRKLREKYGNLKLAIIPRKPERFDEVADLIRAEGFSLVRRSETKMLEASDATTASSTSSSTPSDTAIILGDTIGELRKFYALAEIVFVGRTLVDLGLRQHGSDMIEPAALGKPVIVGPFTTNFAEAIRRFKSANAMIAVQTDQELLTEVAKLLESPATGQTMGRRARQVVQQEQGATARNAEIILNAFVSL